MGPLPEVKRVPTDIFLWNMGEPEQRAVTRISGLPYRAASKPWPLSPAGVPLNFVAQLCFLDSLDLLPSLPGDMLLVFIEGKPTGIPKWPFIFSWGYEDRRDSALHFEWSSLKDGPLVSPEAIPTTPWQLTPFYGTRYRTWDYPDLDGSAYPTIAEYVADILEATKIGGVPPSPWIPQEELGTYLGTLNSVFRSVGPYPLLNIPAPLSAEEWCSMSPFTVGDMGLINLFLSDDGTIRWIADH